MEEERDLVEHCVHLAIFSQQSTVIDIRGSVALTSWSADSPRSGE